MKLFEPAILKNHTLSNRVVMPPMCMYSAAGDGMVTDFHILHYASRAVGGVGLIIVEATGVRPEGRISNYCLGLWDDAQIEGMKKIVDACHSYGAKVMLQLNHAGRKCETSDPVKYAPSAIRFDEETELPKELTSEEILAIEDAFASAAKRAVAAGFDGVEIHGAHGYLISQFLSPLSNKRTDTYGGSPENRICFLAEVTEKVRSVLPDDMLCTLRVSAEDYEPDGMHPEEMASMLLPLRDQFDAIHVSSGGVTPVAPSKVFPGYQVRFAEIIKQTLGIPVIAVGMLTEAHLAEEIVQNDRADFVAVGRALLRDPYWVWNQQWELGLKPEGPRQYVRGYSMRK